MPRTMETGLEYSSLYDYLCKKVRKKIAVVGSGAGALSQVKAFDGLDTMDDIDFVVLGRGVPGRGAVYALDTRGALLNRDARSMSSGPLDSADRWVRWMERTRQQEYQIHKVLMHRSLEDNDTGPTDFESERTIDFSPLLRRRKNAPEICNLFGDEFPVNAYTIDYKSKADFDGEVTVHAGSENSDEQKVHDALKAHFGLRKNHKGDFYLRISDHNDHTGIYVALPAYPKKFKKINLSEPSTEESAYRLHGGLFITPSDDEGKPLGGYQAQAVEAIPSDEQREIIAEQFRDSLADRYLPRPAFGMYEHEEFLELERGASEKNSSITFARTIAQRFTPTREGTWMIEVLAYRPTAIVRENGATDEERKICAGFSYRGFFSSDDGAYELKKFPDGWKVRSGKNYRDANLSQPRVAWLERLPPKDNYEFDSDGFFDEVILAMGGGDPIARPGLNFDPADHSSRAYPYPLRSKVGTIPKDYGVGIIGTGLQMIDPLRELVEAGHKGNIDPLSRGGRISAPRPPRLPHSELSHFTSDAIKNIPYPKTTMKLGPHNKGALAGLPLIVPPTHPAFRDNPRFKALSQGRTVLLVPNKSYTHASFRLLHAPDDIQEITTLNLDPAVRFESEGREKRVYSFLRMQDPAKFKRVPPPNPKSYTVIKQEDGTYTASSSTYKKIEFPINPFPAVLNDIEELAKETELEMSAREWLQFPEAATVTLSRHPKKPYAAGSISPNDAHQRAQEDRQFYVNLIGYSDASTLFHKEQPAPILPHVESLTLEELQSKDISNADAISRISRMFSSKESGVQRLERQLDDIAENDPFQPTMLAIVAKFQRKLWKRSARSEKASSRQHSTIINAENAPMPLATGIAFYKLTTPVVEISETKAMSSPAQRAVFNFLFDKYSATRYMLRQRTDGDCWVTPLGQKRERIRLTKPDVVNAAQKLFDENLPQVTVHSGLKEINQRVFKPPTTYVIDPNDKDPYYNDFKSDLHREDGVESIMLRHELLPLGVHQLEVLQNDDPSGQNKKIYRSDLLSSKHDLTMYSKISERLASIMAIPPTDLFALLDERKEKAIILKALKQFDQEVPAFLSPEGDSHYLLKQGERRLRFEKSSPLGEACHDSLRIGVLFDDDNKEPKFYESMINATGSDPEKPINFFSELPIQYLIDDGFTIFAKHGGLLTHGCQIVQENGEAVKGLHCLGALNRGASPILSISNINADSLTIAKRISGLKREKAEQAQSLPPYQFDLAFEGKLPDGDHSWDAYFTEHQTPVRGEASQPSTPIQQTQQPSPPLAPSAGAAQQAEDSDDSLYRDDGIAPPPGGQSSAPSAPKRKASQELLNPRSGVVPTSPAAPSPSSALRPDTPRRSGRLSTMTSPQVPQQGFPPSAHSPRGGGSSRGRGGR